MVRASGQPHDSSTQFAYAEVASQSSTFILLDRLALSHFGRKTGFHFPEML
jgi:hypothetical protein